MCMKQCINAKAHLIFKKNKDLNGGMQLKIKLLQGAKPHIISEDFPKPKERRLRSWDNWQLVTHFVKTKAITVNDRAREVDCL